MEHYGITDKDREIYTTGCCTLLAVACSRIMRGEVKFLYQPSYEITISIPRRGPGGSYLIEDFWAAVEAGTADIDRDFYYWTHTYFVTSTGLAIDVNMVLPEEEFLASYRRMHKDLDCLAVSRDPVDCDDLAEKASLSLSSGDTEDSSREVKRAIEIAGAIRRSLFGESFAQPSEKAPPKVDAISPGIGVVSVDDVIRHIEKNGTTLTSFAKEQIRGYHKSFRLQMVAVGDIVRDHGFRVSRSKLKRYASMDPSSQPAIVLARKSFGLDLVDGVHRYEAALERGDEEISAYVGI